MILMLLPSSLIMILMSNQNYDNININNDDNNCDNNTDNINDARIKDNTGKCNN